VKEAISSPDRFTSLYQSTGMFSMLLLLFDISREK
jgi:hypothetical protein